MEIGTYSDKDESTFERYIKRSSDERGSIQQTLTCDKACCLVMGQLLQNIIYRKFN